MMRVVYRLDDMPIMDIETKWELGELLDVMISDGGVWGVLLEVEDEYVLPPKFQDVGEHKHGG